MLEFFIPIEPYPKRTGRMALVGRKPRFIANKNTKAYEEKVRSFLKDSLPKVVPFAKDVSLTVEATFYMLRPKTVKRDVPFCKPDLDNLCKSLLDGMEGVLFAGDQQITELRLKKVYAANEDSVGTMIKITTN